MKDGVADRRPSTGNSNLADAKRTYRIELIISDIERLDFDFGNVGVEVGALMRASRQSTSVFSWSARESPQHDSSDELTASRPSIHNLSHIVESYDALHSGHPDISIHGDLSKCGSERMTWRLRVRQPLRRGNCLYRLIPLAPQNRRKSFAFAGSDFRVILPPSNFTCWG